MTKRKPKSKLKAGPIADELFSLVQGAQGRSFISDGMEEMDRKNFLDAVEMAQENTVESAKILTKFLMKYGR